MVFSLFRGAPKAGGKILVAFASQTGAAERVAWLTGNALAGAGFVRVAPLGSLTAAELAEAGTLLVVTSTYGAGEAPDSARAFVKKQMAVTPGFKGLNFAVLALGDRKYDATFCGFGKSVDRWLAAGRGRRLFDIVCVDGDDDVAAMTTWCEQLGRLGAKTSTEALMPGAPQPWILAERLLLNAGSPGGEAWHIALTPKGPGGADLERRRHRRSVAAQPAGRRRCLHCPPPDGRRTELPLARPLDLSARHHRPFTAAGRSRSRRHSIRWLVERLEDFKPREYSIASLPASGRIELLVRKAVKGRWQHRAGLRLADRPGAGRRPGAAAPAAQSQFPVAGGMGR